MSQASMLKVKDLKVNYGGIEALKGISFDVEQGQIVTLIGANGAGKSTTLNTVWLSTLSMRSICSGLPPRLKLRGQALL